MIVGVGTDLCDVKRMESDLRKGERSIRDDVFTAGEIARCESSPRPAGEFAACLAAKEALLKALGLGGHTGFVWRQVEVEHGLGNRPTVRLHGAVAERVRDAGADRVLLSFSRTAAVAVAAVILEGSRGPAIPEEVER